MAGQEAATRMLDFAIREEIYDRIQAMLFIFLFLTLSISSAPRPCPPLGILFEPCMLIDPIDHSLVP